MTLPGLDELGAEFLRAFNARDFDRARELYAVDAIYESAGLVDDANPSGELHGRDAILSYFQAAMAEDPTFKLTMVDQFPGAAMTVVVSRLDASVFIDVLRSNDAGRIIHHAEVTPKRSTLGQ